MTEAEFRRRVARVLAKHLKVTPKTKPQVRRVRVREHWRKVPRK